MKPKELAQELSQGDPGKEVLVDTGSGNYRKIGETAVENGHIIIRLQHAAEPPDQGGDNP